MALSTAERIKALNLREYKFMCHWQLIAGKNSKPSHRVFYCLVGQESGRGTLEFDECKHNVTTRVRLEDGRRPHDYRYEFGVPPCERFFLMFEVDAGEEGSHEFCLNCSAVRTKGIGWQPPRGDRYQK